MTHARNEPSTETNYVVLLEPLDLATGKIRSLYFSDMGFTSTPDDDPPNLWCEPRVLSAFNFEQHMFQAGTLSGQSIPGYGVVELNNADRALDHWWNYLFDNKRIRIWAGRPKAAFSEFSLILDGAVQQIEFERVIVRVLLRDLQHRFDVPIQSHIYYGDGGLSGSSDLAHTLKPLTYGQVIGIEPLLIDPVNLLYQVHDGPIEYVINCYDRGVPLYRTVGASPPPGTYFVDHEKGIIQLGTPPAGVFTADVRGDNTGGTCVASVSTLVRRIATIHAGFTDQDIDLEAFENIEALAPATVGIHISSETYIQTVLDTLVEAIGGHYGFNRAGRLSIGRLDVPGEATVEFSAREILDFQHQVSPQPVWHQTVGFNRRWRPYALSELVPTLTDTRRVDMSNEYRISHKYSYKLRELFPFARKVRRDTVLIYFSDAQKEATRLFALYGTRRDMLRVRLKARLFSLDIGQTVRIVYPRYGYEEGRNFVIVGIIEESAVNEVTLDLWG